MITFLIGLTILLFGYIFYSKYAESQFMPDDRKTPAIVNSDGCDYISLSKNKNALIQLLNIAGMGPILGAIQGILFGPIAFLLIPLGCIFMGGVHDYFCGMISVRNSGMQITGLINKYLGKHAFNIFIFIVAIMLLLLASVFVCTSGDLLAERFFMQHDFSLSNNVIIITYLVIAGYYIIATLFPIDKIIGKIYPYFAGLLLLGTILITIGFFIKGISLVEFDIHNINLHPNKLPLIPMFFMTVSCGLLSGFHSTQSAIISRTLTSEYDGKRIFYGMMCLESLITMIWAAASMHVYNNNLVEQNMIGTANVVNIIANNFVPAYLTFIITIAVVILPITSGDTALRSLRMIIADFIKLPQDIIRNRLLIIIPITVFMYIIIVWSKIDTNSFSLIWRYFTFFNQLITIPVFLFSTIFLFKSRKNYFITFLPALFYVFVTTSFIFSAKIGFNLSIKTSNIIAIVVDILTIIWIVLLCNKQKDKDKLMRM